MSENQWLKIRIRFASTALMPDVGLALVAMPLGGQSAGERHMYRIRKFFNLVLA